jgi:tetratricopeptide (TPR) repeat protein
MTLEEFVTYTEEFAREHGERGTISVRHLQRLLSPRQQPAVLRPATRRLLEAVCSAPIAELLDPPELLASDADHRMGMRATMVGWEHEATELARLVATSSRVEPETLDLLASLVENTRRLDRRFGAATLLGALRLHAEHVEHLLTYATDPAVRRALAVILTDAHTLAGWQSLDRAEIDRSWRHYGKACDAAQIAETSALHAHALAEQAVVLADVGQPDDGAAMTEHARSLGQSGSALLRAWLAAAHGEALAAAGRHADSLRAFDRAAEVLPSDCTPDADGPYMALDEGHLARWRGHALARLGDPDAVPVLAGALRVHDAEFTRAEAALRTDLAVAYLAADDTESATTLLHGAIMIADTVGSHRQRGRLANISPLLEVG